MADNPKVHKTLSPGRPIVASTGSVLTPLAVALNKMLTPVIKQMRAFLLDTTDLLSPADRGHSMLVGHHGCAGCIHSHCLEAVYRMSGECWGPRYMQDPICSGEDRPWPPHVQIVTCQTFIYTHEMFCSHARIY